VRIAVILATRGNPQRAAAVIEAARFMSSGKHDIEYVISCDDDDPDTMAFFDGYRGVTVSCAARPPGTMECLNRVVRSVDADAYMGLADDGFPVTEDWDEHAAKFLNGAFPTPHLGLMAWTDNANPGQPTVMMATREWVAHTGRFQDDRFPFWFSDTCEAETWSFVTYRFMPVVPTLQIVSRGGRPNPRMRDVDFWWDFYIATRGERLETAKRIRAKLRAEGFRCDDNDGMLGLVLNAWAKRDEEGRANCHELAKLVPFRPMDTGYMLAKSRAQAYLAKAAA
jgi:hypothetical protein